MSTLGADSPGRLLRSVFAASPSAAAFVTAGRGDDFPTPSSPLSVASDDSADLDTVTNAVLPRADARVTAIRDHLRAQGLQDAAIDQILLHNWAASTAGGHDSAWHQWERHCDERLDAARRDNPSAADLVNFLQRVRDGDFSDKDVDTFSAEWVRKVRSTVSITVAMWGGVGCRIGEHPLVTSFIQSLTNDDLLNRGRRKYRYDDTWDVEALFASLAAALAAPAHAALRAAGGRRYLNALRDIIVPLGRVLLCCRSSDLHCVYRGEFTEHNCLRFELGAAGHVTSVDIRFYAPKQRRAMPATARGYTDWITVDAVDDPVAIPCFAALLHEYYTLSEHLPRFDDRLFLSSFADRAHEGKLWGLSSDRLAKLMKAAMIAAGIPAEFLPHSARHAGIAHWRGQGMTDDDVMHRANMHAATYVRHYRRRIRTNAAVC